MVSPVLATWQRNWSKIGHTSFFPLFSKSVGVRMAREEWRNRRQKDKKKNIENRNHRLNYQHDSLRNTLLLQQHLSWSQQLLQLSSPGKRRGIFSWRNARTWAAKVGARLLGSGGRGCSPPSWTGQPAAAGTGRAEAEKGEGAPGRAPGEGSPGAAGPRSALPVPTANPRPPPPEGPRGLHPGEGALTPGPWKSPSSPAPPLSAGTPLPHPPPLAPHHLSEPPAASRRPWSAPASPRRPPRCSPPPAPPHPAQANGLPAPLAQTQPGLSNLPTWRPGRPRARPRQPALLPAGGRGRAGGGAARALREAARGGAVCASPQAGRAAPAARCPALRKQEGKLRQISYVGDSLYPTCRNRVLSKVLRWSAEWENCLFGATDRHLLNNSEWYFLLDTSPWEVPTLTFWHFYLPVPQGSIQ